MGSEMCIRDRHKVLSTIVGLILLFVLSLGTTLGIANATRTKDVAIPNLVGKTVDEAKKLVQDSKLVYSEGEAEYSADVEAGKIISQNPKYTQNGTVKEKSEIKVIVSLGTEKTKVPKFVGTTKEEAENKIIGLHEAYFDIKGNKGHASLVAGIDEEAGDVDSMYQLVLQRKGNLSAIEDEMDGK